MLSKEMTEELGNCIFRQFPDEGVYRISRVEEWLATNGYTMEKLGFSDFHELIQAAPELFGTPRYNQDTYVIVKRWNGSGETGHPADSFFGNKNIILNDDIIEMSQQSLYALTKVLGSGLTVQEMKQEIYDSFARAKEDGKLDFMFDRYVFPIGYCSDGYLVNGIITKNISPRGKSLYFSFEKTQIYSSVQPVQTAAYHRQAVQQAVSSEDKAEIYRLLTANFPFDVPQHMAAVSKYLSDNHIDRSRFGFFKMKDLLSQMDYLDLDDVVLGGVPQVMVTIRHSDKYQPGRPASFSAFQRAEQPASVRPAFRAAQQSAQPVQPAKPTQVQTASTEAVEIPEGALEDFCNLPPKPMMILAQYLERTGINREIPELRGDISEDFSAARQGGNIRFYEGKMIFPTRWKRSDGTSVELTLKPSAYEGRPWFLSFVDTLSRDGSQRPVQPGKHLESFAYLGSWNSFLSELSEKAIAENWDFGGSRRGDHYILIQYIKYTFYRLTRENKVCISADRKFACFNTGLVDRHYDDIYACFTPNEPGSETEWKFAGFCTAANRTLGKQIVNYFNPLPQPPVYFDRGEQLFFDVKRQLLTDFDHIILDNISRLPLSFLEEQFTDCPEARELAAQIRSADGCGRRALYEQLKEIVNSNDRLFMRIQNRIKDSIELAKKRVSRNYKTAIPSYFPKRNSMSLMLPLCLVDEEKPDVALVVEQTPAGNYQGQTILTLTQAYIDARLLCQLNSEWLTTDISTGDESDDGEDSAETAD